MNDKPLPESWNHMLEDPTAAVVCYHSHTKAFHWDGNEHEKNLRRQLEAILTALSKGYGKIPTRVFENELLGHLGALRHDPLNAGLVTLSPEQLDDRKREEFDTEIYEHKSYRSVPRSDEDQP